jgi:hypothetical protein
LTDSKYHFTEVNDNIYSYLIGAGSYCEAYFQKQEIDYDISKISSLQKKKAVLDEYDNILSREYMRKQCVSDADELIYIQDTQRARANYKEKYDEYITELEAYLKSLE